MMTARRDKRKEPTKEKNIGRFQRGLCLITSRFKRDHDISSATVKSSEGQRAHVRPDFEGFFDGIVDLCWRQIRGVVHDSAQQRKIL